MCCEAALSHLIRMACRIVELYRHLSAHAHPYQQSDTAVDIVEGPVNREQMVLLECLAQAAGLPCNMVYLERPSAVDTA